VFRVNKQLLIIVYNIVVLHYSSCTGLDTCLQSEETFIGVSGAHNVVCMR